MPQPFQPLPLGVDVVVAVVAFPFLVLLAEAGPSISATSSRLLLDPPLTSLDLPGPPGCFFPVISLLNGEQSQNTVLLASTQAVYKAPHSTVRAVLLAH